MLQKSRSHIRFWTKTTTDTSLSWLTPDQSFLPASLPFSASSSSSPQPAASSSSCLPWQFPPIIGDSWLQNRCTLYYLLMTARPGQSVAGLKLFLPPWTNNVTRCHQSPQCTAVMWCHRSVAWCHLSTLQLCGVTTVSCGVTSVMRCHHSVTWCHHNALQLCGVTKVHFSHVQLWAKIPFSQWNSKLLLASEPKLNTVPYGVPKVNKIFLETSTFDKSWIWL